MRERKKKKFFPKHSLNELGNMLYPEDGAENPPGWLKCSHSICNSVLPSQALHDLPHLPGDPKSPIKSRSSPLQVKIK